MGRRAAEPAARGFLLMALGSLHFRKMQPPDACRGGRWLASPLRTAPQSLWVVLWGQLCCCPSGRGQKGLGDTLGIPCGTGSLLPIIHGLASVSHPSPQTPTKLPMADSFCQLAQDCIFSFFIFINFRLSNNTCLLKSTKTTQKYPNKKCLHHPQPPSSFSSTPCSLSPPLSLPCVFILY